MGSNDMNIESISDQRMRRDAIDLRSRLREAEDRSDALLEGTADLMKAMVRARRAADVAPHTGQTAIMRLVRAQQSIVSGANDLFRVHDELSSLGVELAILDEGNATPPSKGLDQGASNFDEGVALSA